jgi:predicted MFS family arabinose efflux permease
MRTYGRLLRHPPTTVSLLAAFIGAIPIGMWPLAIVLGALDRGGSPADAGLVAAVFGIGNAIGVVTQGALLARVRATRLLPAFAALGIVAAVLLQGDGSLAGAALAGIAIPAITPAVRGRFAGTLAGPDRPGAYALVNVLFQAGIAVGPLVAAALAASGLGRWAPPIAAVGGLAAAGLLVVADLGRGRAPALSTAPVVVPVGGGVARAGVLVLLAVATTAGFGIGTLQVLIPVRAGAATSGAAFAAIALAEVGGAVLLGGRAGSRHAFRLLVGGAAAMAVVYLLLGAGLAAVPAAVLLGVATSVQSLGSALGLDRFVPAARVSAVFSMQIAVLIIGAAAGSLVAGIVPDTAFVLASLLLGAAAVAALLVTARPVPGVLRPGGPRVHAR